MQSNGKKTIFTYDAFGTKLKKQEYTGTTLTLTNDYLGSVQYLNGTSQFAATAEGRVYNNSGTYRYDYFMKDQVGNIRMTYTANGTGVTVLQRDEYYPFGNTFDSYLVSGSANNYKFNGMEFEENNLNTFDFHARMYDPQIGRSFQPDPLADRFVSKSPYSFLANNPVMYTDPTGMTVEPSDDRGGDGQGGFGSIGPSTTLQWGSWFLNNTMNYRGGNGFLAAFRGDGWGNRRSRYVPMNTNQLITTVERFKDWYFSSKYTGTHYTGTEYLGSYMIINDLAQGDRGSFKVNEYREWYGDVMGLPVGGVKIEITYTGTSSMKDAKWMQLIIVKKPRPGEKNPFNDGYRDALPYYLTSDEMKTFNLINGNTITFTDNPYNSEDERFRANTFLFLNGQIIFSFSYGYDYNKKTGIVTKMPLITH